MTAAGTLRGDAGLQAGSTGQGAVAAKNTAKAWINFNGLGTPAIRDSFNVSSITDNGTGDYTLNFTTAMANANYAIVATVGSRDRFISPVDRATGSCRLLCENNTGSAFDDGDIYAVFFGA
jgi:hypothetical protein